MNRETKRYIKKVKRYVKKNPEQTALLLYNAGVFGWLQANVRGIEELTQFTQGPLQWINPQHIETAKGFITSLPYGWLIGSVVLTYFIKKMRRMTKNLVMIGLIFAGLYFMYTYAKTNGWL